MTFRPPLPMALLFLVAACGGELDPTGVGNGHSGLPPRLLLVATAQGTPGELRIDCGIRFLVELRPPGAWAGSWGGEAKRIVIGPDGNGIGLIADAHSDVRVSRPAPGRLRLESWQNGRRLAPTGVSRFWDGILAFEGSWDPAARRLTGTWTCHPMDTRGDDAGPVAGSWTAQPAE